MANAVDDLPVTDADLPALFDALGPSRGIILGVSGGSDSTALMVLFARWALKNQIHASSLVVTVDHGLRPEAATEADQVAAQARALGLRHRVVTWSGEKPTSDIQHAARTARYRLLADVAHAEGADTLLTAHTRDDQAETFLLALARGSGIYGLAAMPTERALQGIRLHRPLLGLPKARLVATLRQAGLRWSEDPSNVDERYRRVAMRKGAPMLAGLGLTAATLAATADRLGRAAAAIEIYADRLIAKAITVHSGGFLEVDAAPCLAEPEEVALRAFARMLKAMTGAAYVPRLDRLERLFGEIRTASRAGTPLTRTLGGVTVALSTRAARTAGPRLWLFAEAGRTGFASARLDPGRTLDWDNRMRITLSQSAEAPVTIRALGPGARRHLGTLAPPRVPAAALATLASAWRDDRLVEIVDAATSHHRSLSAVALVGPRLLRA